MCGIFGIYGSAGVNISKSEFKKNLLLLKHRGPDDMGEFFDKNIMLGHRRLSIIDTHKRSSQPFIYNNFVIVFNGEIYNYRKIKQRLIIKGYQFFTNSDTEVVIAAWIEWKYKCFDFFEGMFSLAIWDIKSSSLIIARDKFGEKPLFWTKNDNKCIFASELSPIFNILKNKPNIDLLCQNLYMKLSFIPAPKSIFKNIYQVEPGTYLKFKDKKIEKHSYTNFLNTKKPFNLNHDYNFAKRKIKKLLFESVKLRIESSDVPVATLLSGGIDSSIITYIASKFTKKNKKLVSYTLGFPEDPEYDETKYAKEVVKNISNIDHRIINVKERDIIDNVSIVINKLGEPFSDSSLIPTYLLFKKIEEKVVLSGDGADEIFGGYGIYPAINTLQNFPNFIKMIIQSLPKPKNAINISNAYFRRLGLVLENFDISSLKNYINWRSYASEETLSKLNINSQILNNLLENDYLNDFNNIQELLKLDIRFNLPNDMLKKIDYASMFNSIEVRLPFLNTKLLDFVQSLPTNYLIKRNNRKKILKDSFLEIFGSNFLNRKKQGFLLPVRKWLIKGELNEDLRYLINFQKDFDKNVVLSLLEEHEKSYKDHSVILWSIYVYVKWKMNLKYDD